MAQNTNDGVTDAGESCGAELGIAAVPESYLSLIRKRDELIFDHDLCAKDGKVANAGDNQVRPELGWEEALDTSGNGGVDEKILASDGETAQR
ncbi:hypothetical protein HG530_007666 [Fusarium avenaceum]|nr:hypothetical protein HG530_007666 [Fusarium avenaceum]